MGLDGSDGLRWVQIWLDVFEWFQIGLQRFGLVHMDQVSLDVFGWFLMGSDGLRWVPIELNGIEWVQMN